MNKDRSMHKTLSSLLIMLTVTFLLLSGALQVSAYSSTYTDDEFTLEIPDTWHQVVEMTWSDPNGTGVNITINPYTENLSYDDIYSQDMLDEIEDMMINDFDSGKEDIKEQMISQYGDLLSEEEISNYVDSLHVEGFLDKDITTFTKNSYPCLHARMIMKGTFKGEEITMVEEQYETVSNHKAYIVTSNGDLSDQNLQDTIDSFTINDYDPPASSGFGLGDSGSSGSYDTGSGSSDDVFGNAIKKGAATGVMYALVFGGIGLIINKIRSGKDGKKKSGETPAASISEPSYQARPADRVAEPVSKVRPAAPADRPASQESPAAAQFPRMKMCPNCGKISNSRFCPACGTEIPDPDVR